MTKKTFQRQLVVLHPLQLVRTTPTDSRAEIRAPSSMALTHHTHTNTPQHFFPKWFPSYPSTLLPGLGDKNEHPRDLAKFWARLSPGNITFFTE